MAASVSDWNIAIIYIPYLDDWLIHHPDHQVLLQHQARLLSTLDLVGLILNRKKSELDLTQDLQFSRNPFTSGLRGSFPSRVQNLGDCCTRTPSILPPSTDLFSSVPAYGVTQLGLRSYTSGLFVPGTPSTSFSLIRSDKPVYATESIRPTGPCQPFTALAGPTFSYIRNPYPHISGGLHVFYGGLHAGVGRSHGGFPDFGYLDPYRPQAPYQLSGAQGGSLCRTALGPSAPGPPGYDRPLPLVRGLEHNSPGKAYSRLSERDSRPPISSESANIDRVVPASRDSEIFRIWGTPEVDMFPTVSNSHLPRFMSPIPEPRALAVDALSQDWQGRSMYMFPRFPLLNKVIQKLQSTQAAEVVLIAPWWPSQSWFPHLLRLCVEHPLAFPHRLDLLSQQDQKYVSNGK